MKTLLLILAILFQDDNLTRAIMLLTGATDPSELEVTEIEHYETLASRPVLLNGRSSGELVSSGLMTRYQAASLSDYRKSHGDVLSVEELSLIDGFNAETARSLALFLDFRPSARKDSVRVRSDLTLKGSWKDKDLSFGGKYLMSREGRGSVGVAFRSLYDGSKSGSFHLSGRTSRVRYVAGDMNARFGEGLLSWTGFEMSSLSSLSSFSHRPSGLSPVTSYSGTGTLRGLGGEASFGRFTVSTVLSFEGLKERMEGGKGEVSLLALGNCTWCGRKGEGGISISSKGRLSVDGRCNYRGVALFGEAALDWKVKTGAFRGGTILPLGEHFKTGLQLNIMPSAYSGKKYGEYSGSLGLDYTDGVYVKTTGNGGTVSSEVRNKGTLTLSVSLLPYPVKDPDRRRLKAVATWNSRLSPLLQLSVRSALTLRNFSPWNRIDSRADLTLSDGPLLSRIRGNLVFAGSASGFLSYIEGGYRPGKDSYYLRATVFRSDTWDSRLYSYERDAPGSFSVPAYWGRGCAFSAYSKKEAGKWKFYLRLSYVMKKEKPGSAELKFQVARTF